MILVASITFSKLKRGIYQCFMQKYNSVNGRTILGFTHEKQRSEYQGGFYEFIFSAYRL